MQGVALQLFRLGMGLVIQRRGGVEIPAIVIEPAGRDERADIVRRLAFQLVESHNHIGDLNAGVVDVVLNLDLAAAGAQHADKSVSQNRVAQVADVRRFVRIDVSVLDDHLARNDHGGNVLAAQQAFGVGAAVQAQIKKSAAGDLDGSDSRDGRQSGRDLRGNGARRFA